MRRGWLSGKPHPVTGAPMECEEVRLPPGSLVACVSHAAHRVNPTAAAGPGRLAMSLFAHGADFVMSEGARSQLEMTADASASGPGVQPDDSSPKSTMHALHGTGAAASTSSAGSSSRDAS